MAEKFNVCRFLANGTSKHTAQGVSPNEAVKKAVSLIQSEGAVSGAIQRVVITDSSNDIRWEWTYQNGISHSARAMA